MTSVGTVSDPRIRSAARSLRVVCLLAEIGLSAMVGGAAFAFGGVVPWLDEPLWIGALVLMLLVLERARLIGVLRRLIGARRFAFHPSGLWLVLDEEAPYGMPTWSFDLGRPSLPAGPLLLPGVLFACWAGLQLAPVSPTWIARLSARRAAMISGTDWATLSVSPEDTARGLLFLLALLGYHSVSAALFQGRRERGRFRVVMAVFGVALSAVALAQLATNTRYIYWTVEPEVGAGSANIFGPFANRNHFAGYMLLVVPLCFDLVGSRFRRYRIRVGPKANLRRWLVALDSPEGTRLAWAVAPAGLTALALVAANSRGGLLAFAGGLALAGAALWRRGRLTAVLFPALAVAVGLSWFGLERVGGRFEQAADDSAGRTVVWADTLERMDGLWATGSGFNTFAAAMSRATAWQLPRGASPWRAPIETSLVSHPNLGYLSHLGTARHSWYREAHNDYLQALVEVGVPGLVLALFAAGAVVWRVRGDPWLLAAVTGVLLHAVVEFDLQIPAVALLFSVVAGIPPERRSGAGSTAGSPAPGGDAPPRG